MPQAGRLLSPGTAVVMVVVGMWVAVADEQYALPNAITVLATAVPQAPFEQSRIP